MLHPSTLGALARLISFAYPASAVINRYAHRLVDRRQPLPQDSVERCAASH